MNEKRIRQGIGVTYGNFASKSRIWRVQRLDGVAERENVLKRQEVKNCCLQETSCDNNLVDGSTMSSDDLRNIFAYRS